MKIESLYAQIDKEIDSLETPEKSIIFLNNTSKKRKNFFYSA